jgi:hypothetical protein
VRQTTLAEGTTTESQMNAKLLVGFISFRKRK